MKHVVLIPITGYVRRVVEADRASIAIENAMENLEILPSEIDDITLHDMVMIENEAIWAVASPIMDNDAEKTN